MKEIRFKNETHKKVYELLTQGFSTQEIADQLGYHRTTIIKIRKSLIDRGLLKEPIRGSFTEKMIRKFFEEHAHWEWDAEHAHLPKKPSKYRTVKKGEQGHLRTPYRPDGIFR